MIEAINAYLCPPSIGVWANSDCMSITISMNIRSYVWFFCTRGQTRGDGVYDGLISHL